MNPTIRSARMFAGAILHLMDLVVDADLQPLLIADVDGIDVTVHEAPHGPGKAAIVEKTNLQPAAANPDGSALLTDTLRTAGWTKNATGYNFRWALDGRAVALRAGHTYLVQSRLRTTSGDVIVQWAVSVQASHAALGA